MTVIEFHEKGNYAIKEIPLVPMHDMRDVRGEFDDILENTEKSEDYIRVILTNETLVPNAVGKLRHIMPNILELCYESHRTSGYETTETTEEDIRSNPSDVFIEFYRIMFGHEPSDEETAIIEDVIREAKEEMN